MAITLILRESPANAISEQHICRKVLLRQTEWGSYFQVKLTPECTVGFPRWSLGSTHYYKIIAPGQTYYLLNQGREGDEIIPKEQWLWRYNNP
jgi:hypothetical protein